MTLCIAAACHDADKNPCMVLCSDTRVDYGELGSTNAAAKLDVLGHGWCVQMAGDWANVGHWRDYLRRQIQTPNDASIEQVGEYLRESADSFKKSVFCDPGRQYQLLLSGFPENTPVMLSAFLEPKDNDHVLSVTISDHFSCIGSGAAVASAFLTARECWSRLSLEYVAYLAYEAKRNSEKTGTVGSTTVLFVQTAGAHDSIDAACFGPLSKHGKEQLESLYRQVWRVPFVTLPAFTAEYFTDSKGPGDLPQTKADP